MHSKRSQDTAATRESLFTQKGTRYKPTQSRLACSPLRLTRELFTN